MKKTDTTRAPGVKAARVASVRTSMLLLPAVALLAMPAKAFEFDPFGTPSEEETAGFKKAWDFFVLYQNDKNPILEEFKLIGKYQGQYYWVDSDQGDTDAWEDRRSRFGFDAKMFEKTIEIRATFQSTDNFDPVYNGLEDAYIKWKPSKNFTLTAGHIKPLIGYFDWLQSSDLQQTFDSSQVFNQLRVNRILGLTAEGKVGDFSWQAGAYSNDSDKEFGKFGGEYSFGAGVGYDAKECFGWERADFRLDWIHSGHDKDDFLFTRYDDLVSATFWAQEGPFQLVVEAFNASGGEGRDGDVFGFFIQPMYDIIPKRLQLVGRYSYTTGDGADSVYRQTRYESEAPLLTGGGRGDEYNAIYLGAQYFIYGDKLKLMAGGEYADLDGGGNGGDYQGVTWLTGARFYF
ncbi:porin [Luteolibacter sp. Populi]|uniref:porin n=1 Tax=Luteolibacter sp. Populi TaxID=3230487 RepID=UPI0034672297